MSSKNEGEPAERASTSEGPGHAACTEGSPSACDRRGFLARGSQVVMLGGLVTSYGTCAYVGGRFLYPARPVRREWMLVGPLNSIAAGSAIAYSTPTGAKLTIARQGSGTALEDFIALSSTCPHLGCKVNWEALNQRFFCPCHNGVFDPGGKAISGPPADAGQELARYSLKIENGLLFIEVETEGVQAGRERREAQS